MLQRAHLGKAEVAQLGIALLIDEHVLGLEVPVHCRNAGPSNPLAHKPHKNFAITASLSWRPSMLECHHQSGQTPQQHPRSAHDTACCATYSVTLRQQHAMCPKPSSILARTATPGALLALHANHNQQPHPPMLWSCRYSSASTMLAM
jgi:hypothetical protein